MSLFTLEKFEFEPLTTFLKFTSTLIQALQVYGKGLLREKFNPHVTFSKAFTITYLDQFVLTKKLKNVRLQYLTLFSSLLGKIIKRVEKPPKKRGFMKML